MKKLLMKRNLPKGFSGAKCTWWLCGALLMVLGAAAQEKAPQPPGFSVIGRQPVQGAIGNRLLVSGGNNAVAAQLENRDGRPWYQVQAPGINTVVPALSSIEVSGNHSRIWCFGDSMATHLVQHAYATVYTAAGIPVRSLGKIGSRPFAAAVTYNGSLVFAGRNPADSGGRSCMLALYGADGNRQWQKLLPATPVEVFPSADLRYIAVLLYDDKNGRNLVQYYTGTGQLLHTDNSGRSVAAIEFLPSGKAVIAAGDGWRLVDLTKGFKIVMDGRIKGNALGRYPITAHPSKDIFFLVSAAAQVKKAYALQAIDAGTGKLLARSVFEGDPYWVSHRLATIGRDEVIRLQTDREIISLQMQ